MTTRLGSCQHWYDANGNLTRDDNKGITSVQYNHVNLVTRVQKSATQYIDYMYDAAGTKLRSILVNGTGRDTTHYIAGIKYKGSNVDFISTAEGIVKRQTGTTYEYQYILRDHLGSTRVMFNQNGTVLQRNAYYPFGLNIPNQTVSGGGVAHKYQYNGKERQGVDFDLGWTDYGARMYDAAIGRWHVVDPLAKAIQRFSPFSYAVNNPLRLIDYEGKYPVDIIVTTNSGKELFRLDDGKKEITKMTAKQVYDRGIQWFEPRADNYMRLVYVAKDIRSNGAIKHFTWNQILDFSLKERNLLSYYKGGSGDWKAAKNGANGHFLVEVDGEPYWADAIGQIPFTIDYFTDVLLDEKGDKQKAAKKTKETAQEWGDGTFFGEADYSKSYDNAMVERTISWAIGAFTIEEETEKNFFGQTVYKVKYNRSNPNKMGGGASE